MTTSASISIVPVRGNAQRLDGGSMFGNAPRVVWEQWMQPDEKHRVTLACRAMLVDVDGYRILCETGIGAFFPPKLRERFGVVESQHVLLEQLQQFGLTEDSIDAVILSHLHFDHAGGLLPAFEESQGHPQRVLFPRAQYVVGQESWNRALNPHPRDRASFIPELMPLLEQSGRLHLVQDGKRPAFLPDCISFRFSHGHTPGQMHTMVRGAKQTVIFAGDLIPGTPWVHAPITMGYDRFPELLIEEKRDLYENGLNDGDWLFYCHDPKFAFSQVAKNEKGRYVPCHTQDDDFQLTL